jgi:hypothetical protein
VVFDSHKESGGEYRDAQKLSIELKELILAKADSVMVAKGEDLSRYVRTIAQNDLRYTVFYQGKDFKGAPSISLDKATLSKIYFNPGK